METFPDAGQRLTEEIVQTARQHPQSKPPKCRDTSLSEPKVEGQEQVPPATRVRKRQIDSEDDGDDEHELKRARLTRKNLTRFNKMAKRKGTSKGSAPTSAPPDSTVDSNGILDPLNSKPPTNLENIHEQHARSRATASPPELRFKRYSRTVSKAGNEATMVHVHVSGAVLYKDDPYSVTLPHLAGEWKGPDGSMAEATLQSRYDGAALVYIRNQAPSLIGKPDPPGHAEVRTFTTDGTNINFYAHYAAPSENNDTLEYHQYQYASANVKDTYQGHKDGYKGIRNEQDHAKDQSYVLRDQLKKHWKQRRGGLQPITEGAPLPDLDEFPEAPFPARESNFYPDDDGEVEEPLPSAKSARYKRISRRTPPACGYWKWDARSDLYFHKHSDGRVTWAEDDSE
ncbi:hypothetical protein QBC35DRAFT_522957 [Podospora australis]|uniref:Uncharacterized protein n=1 Tax=Podospora australis TaxID=1536484 RepID=A0AAN6WUG4_9PEZI|nr:hypothetical protein QBC35DRAFT_522957 [Podospora australis]